MKRFILIGIIIVFWPSDSFAVYDLPNDDNDCPSNCRQIPWSAGLDQHGGITNYTNKKNAVTDYSADNTGVSNAHTEIQNCLNGVTPPGACYLPNGTYKIAGDITIPSNVVLRGQSRSGTTLWISTASASNNGQRIILGTDTSYDHRGATELSVNVEPSKGDTDLGLSGTTGLASGDYISIFQDNDTTIPVANGGCTWCGKDDGSGDHLMQQYAKIANISGNTITIDRPLYYDYNDASNNVVVSKAAWEVWSAGIEDLTVDGSNVDDGLILAWEARHCWIKNVHTYMAGSSSGEPHIKLSFSYAIEVRDSLIHHGKGHASGANYGIFLLYWNSDHKFENNVIIDVRHGINHEGGGSGTAALYNYMEDTYESEDTTFLSADLNPNHGAHPFMNLAEGNSTSKIVWDNTFGSSSHNVAFRNHARGDRSTPAYSWGQWAIDIQAQNNYMSLAGNVAGSASWSSGTSLANSACEPTEPNAFRFGCNGQPGAYSGSTAYDTAILHGNYDYVNDSVGAWQGGADHSLKNSMYYDSEPSWWQDDSAPGYCRPWPPIGPDVTGLVVDIPAKDRYEGQTYSGILCAGDNDDKIRFSTTGQGRIMAETNGVGVIR